MEIDKERRNNGDYYYTVDRPSSSSSSCSLMMESNFFPISPSSPPPSSYSSAGGSVTVTTGVGGIGYIEHTVSKFDTLAGVAIKYGVEVADIKKMNGLVTDLQMFALKSLHIPLPGRHPPSPILANGIDTPGPSNSEHTPATRRHSDLFDSFQSLRLKSSPQRRVSPAMSSLQGYYGLKQKDRSNALGQSCEMAVYHKEGSHYLEDGPLGKPSSPAPTLGLHRKSKSLAYGLSENGDVENNNTMSVASENWIDKLIRRRQKSEADFNKCTTEKLLKEDNSSGGFSAVAGKGLALRPKAAAASRTADPDAGGWPSPFPLILGDSSADSNSGVRKSSSTPSFLDQDNNKDNSNGVSSSSSIWPTSKWSLKSDLQALSTAAIAMPIFDGLPKPITGRKNKAALD